MFIKKLDFLSPPITLFFQGENAHSSIFSAILSLISYLLITGFGFTYALEFINKENPTAYFFNRYIEDAGIFPVNASSMFGFIQMMNSKNILPKEVDFDSVRIIGLDRITIDNYMANNDLEQYNHWLYGYCNNNSDTKGIGHLIVQDKFEQSACIRKYYNMETKKYYDTGDPNFVWPVIHHGVSHPDANMYGIIMEKCRNDTLRKLSGASYCKTPKYIDEYTYSSYIRFMLMDNYADVLNYKNPITKYLYAVTNGVFPGTFTTNHFNFNPALIRTDNGIFVDRIKDEKAYFFTLNEKITSNQDLVITDDIGNPILNDQGNEQVKSTGIIIAFYFWMQNRLQFYQRNYKKLQDVLGDIGGLSSIVLTIANLINLLVNDFNIILDTKDLLLSTNIMNINNIDLNKKKIIFLKLNNEINSEKKNTPKRHYLNKYINTNTNKKSHLALNKKKVDIYLNNSENSGKNVQEGNILFNKSSNSHMIFSERANYDKEFKLNENPKELKNEQIYKNKRENRSLNNNQIEKRISWFSYFVYMIQCCRNNSQISYYENFRTNLISEENIIQNYLNISKLLKMTNLGNKEIINTVV